MRRTPPFVHSGLIAGLLCLAAIHATSATASSIEPPTALRADGIPPVPAKLMERIQPYLEYNAARFLGWHPVRKSILVGTRLEDSRQLYEVTAPGSPFRQITFEDEPITSGEFAPSGGDVTLALADAGGDEQFQIYRVDEGKMIRLTDGKARNLGIRWTPDGKQIGYSTTRRTGLDTDLHMMDPRDPKSDRLVMAGRGGGWSFADFLGDGKRALLFNYLSVTQSSIFEIDMEKRTLLNLVPPTAEVVSFGTARYGPGDRIFAITDRGAEHRYIAEIDRSTGTATRINPETRWSVEDFAIDPRGKFIAYLVNENGVSRLRLIDLERRILLPSPELPDGMIYGLEIAPWGEVGFSISSADSPGDVFSIDPSSLALTRWTNSLIGETDPTKNSRPETVSVKSFDDVVVSGLLYRPDAKRFPGKRPVIVSFHGGPEGQSRPGYLGRNNYLVNELGIALFYPNVRGSTGYGKTFVTLDNGPDRREHSVRDLGAFLKAFNRDPGIDARRMAATGGSYGGYMALAALIRYPKHFRAGVSIVGISNFVTFLEKTGGYRRDLRRLEYGDERVPSDRRKLDKISPLTNAERIRVPLLVVSGANDPRVPPSEAEQIVAAVRAGGGEAWHLVADDEGHGFARKSNSDYQFGATVLFWERYLVGSAGEIAVLSR